MVGYQENPFWFEAKGREHMYGAHDTLGHELALIDGEYANARRQNQPCAYTECDGVAWYKATVGAFKCTTCSGITTHAGQWLG